VGGWYWVEVEYKLRDGGRRVDASARASET
jgi:hypothetical protein